MSHNLLNDVPAMQSVCGIPEKRNLANVLILFSFLLLLLVILLVLNVLIGFALEGNLLLAGGYLVLFVTQCSCGASSVTVHRLCDT
jgi:hypothetical protein